MNSSLHPGYLFCKSPYHAFTKNEFGKKLFLIISFLFGAFTASYATTPVDGVTNFDNLYTCSFVDLTGIQSAGATGLAANDVDGYNFKIFSLNNIADCGIGIEPFTGQTAIVYGYSESGQSLVDSLEISSNGLNYFDLQSVDITWDNGTTASRNITLTGYHNGNPVAGATLTMSLQAASGGGLLATFDVSSNSAFVGIDKFTITVPGTDVGAIGVDNINAINFRSTVLPLTLTSFTGKPLSNGIQLNWNSGNEFNVSSFGIERSTDGISFENIGNVLVNTTGTGAAHTYTYIDANAASNSAYFYRLKMKDHDGHFTYSSTVKINSSAFAKRYSIYPNPVTSGVLHLKVPPGTSGEIKIAVISNDGKELDKKIFNTGNVSGNYIDIPVNRLLPGVYRLRINEIKTGVLTTLQFVK